MVKGERIAENIESELNDKIYFDIFSKVYRKKCISEIGYKIIDKVDDIYIIFHSTNWFNTNS